jgi:hypothetical protein
MSDLDEFIEAKKAEGLTPEQIGLAWQERLGEKAQVIQEAQYRNRVWVAAHNAAMRIAGGIDPGDPYQRIMQTWGARKLVAGWRKATVDPSLIAVEFSYKPRDYDVPATGVIIIRHPALNGVPATVRTDPLTFFRELMEIAAEERP